MTITRYILLLLLFIPTGTFAKSSDPVLLAGNIIEEQAIVSVDLLFWSKVFILLLIVIFGFVSYRNFRSEER